MEIQGNFFKTPTPELRPARHHNLQDTMASAKASDRILKPQGTVSAKAPRQELARQVPGKTMPVGLKY